MDNYYINKIKEIFKEPEIRSAINNKDFEKVYKTIYATIKASEYRTISYLTRIFYNVGIDPLLYMEKVPEYFLAFQEGISQINIPKNIKSIGFRAFNSTGIVNLIIPEGVEFIAARAFVYCTKLVNVKLPSTLETVHSNIFENCHNLRNIEYAGTKNDFQLLFFNNFEDLNHGALITCQDGKMKYRKITKEWVDID